MAIPSLFASVLGVITLSLLPLSLSPHLLQLLAVLPLDEALLMGHLREVIWNTVQNKCGAEVAMENKPKSPSPQKYSRENITWCVCVWCPPQLLPPW